MTTAPEGALERATRRLDALDAVTLPVPPYFALGSDLSGDHPPFPVVPEALQELTAALERNETHYTDVMGIAPLREKVARVLVELGLGAHDPQTVMITAGEQEARFVALQTLARAGYAPLLPSVVHPGARKAAAVGGHFFTLLTVDETLAPTPAGVREAFSRRGRAALYLEVPNRFTGRVVDPGRLTDLLSEVRRADGMMVVDAGLVPWLLPSLVPSVLSDGETADVLWLLGSLFPGTGIDGWRSGYLAVPALWAGQARSMKQIVAICTSAPVQWAALGALQEAGDRQAARRDSLFRLRGEAVSRLPEGAALPGDAAAVLALRMPTTNESARGLLPFRAAPGEAFGVPGGLRVTITSSGEALAAAEVLARRLSGRSSGRS